MANNQLLASDNFASGSLAAGWSSVFGLSVCQVVSNRTEPAALSAEAGQIWTGLTWPNDHTSEVTLGAGTTQEVTTYNVILRVRMQSGANSGYRADITNGTALLFKLTAGATVQLGSTVSGLTAAAGDIWVLQAAGSCISLYQNGTRVLYFYDVTYASGSPGYSQFSSSNIAHSVVASWRGYSAVQQDGVWQKQGIVIPAIAADLTHTTAGTGLQCWSIFQDTNAQLLSGTVYKAWLISDQTNDANSAMYYAESADGINWTRRASPVLSNFTNGSVFKNGSTYYMYCQASGASGSGTMQVFTSSDGISWAQQTPSQTIGLGGVGAWDHGSFYNIITVVISNGTWYGFYNGNNGGAFSTGFATSTDGINWVKSASNPVISSVLTAGAIALVNGTYYQWGSSHQTGQGASTLDPYDTVRYSSTNLTSWTLSSHSVHHSQLFESLNAGTGGIVPAGIATVGNKTYLWANSAPNDGAAPQVSQISLAIAPAVIASLVTAPEDGTSQIAVDPFTSGAGNLSPNWVTPTGSTKLQIVSGPFVEATTLGAINQMCYTGSVFNANQYSEITLHAATNVNQFLCPTVRAQIGSDSCYFASIKGPLGSSNPSTDITARVNGVNTQIGPLYTLTPSVGDVFRLSVITGSDGFPVLSLFQNGFLILQVQDTTNALTSGFPGMLMLSATSLSNNQISSWAGGNANVIPTYPALVYSVPDSRTVTTTTPNSSRSVQGTLTYDVPKVFSLMYWFDTLFNRTQPLPVDSRTSKPVDSRSTTAGTTPQNSRTPGTYGPGE